MYKNSLLTIGLLATAMHAIPVTSGDIDTIVLPPSISARDIDLGQVNTSSDGPRRGCELSFCQPGSAGQQRAPASRQAGNDRAKRQHELPALTIGQAAPITDSAPIMDEDVMDARLELSQRNGTWKSGGYTVGLSNAVHSEGALTRNGAGTMSLRATTDMEGAARLKAGRLVFNSRTAAGSAVKLRHVRKTPAKHGRNPLTRTPSRQDLRISATPGALTFSGDVSLTDSGHYLVGVNGYGSAGITPISPSGNGTIIEPVLSEAVFANRSYQLLARSRGNILPLTDNHNSSYATNSMVLSLGNGQTAFNSALYGGLDAALADNGGHQNDTGVHADVFGVFNTLNSLDTQSARQLFSTTSRAIRHRVVTANRLTNRLLRHGVLTHARKQKDVNNARSAPINVWLEISGHRTVPEVISRPGAYTRTSMAYYGGIDTRTALLDRVGISLGATTTSMSADLASRAATDNYHALMYVYDRFHGYDISLVAGSAWGEYRAVMVDTGARTPVDDMRNYGFSMDAEIRRSVQYSHYRLSGIGGFLVEYGRSHAINPDEPYNLFPGNGYAYQNTQLHLGGELLLSDRFFSNDEITLASRWQYGADHDGYADINNVMFGPHWLGRPVVTATSGVKFNAGYALNLNESSRLSLSYSAMTDSHDMEHQALASANLHW